MKLVGALFAVFEQVVEILEWGIGRIPGFFVFLSWNDDAKLAA